MAAKQTTRLLPDLQWLSATGSNQCSCRSRAWRRRARS